MSTINVKWTNEQAKEYARQMSLIRASYPWLEEATIEMYAAEVVNKKK